MLSPKESRELGLKIKSYGNKNKDLDLYYNGKITREEYKKRADDSLIRELRTYLLNNNIVKLKDLPSKFDPIVKIR